MADPRHLLGSRAENATAAWLEAQGWTVLARRYRPPGGGEVDLVLLDPAGTLVGVEVRARSSARSGLPEESVDAARAARIARSLVAYAALRRPRHSGLRVDLVAGEPVDGSRLNGLIRLRRIPDIGGWRPVTRRRASRVP